VAALNRNTHNIKGKEDSPGFAHVLDNVKEKNYYELRQLLGKEAFYDSFHDVVSAYQQQTGIEAK
jgi:hypothetical protein